VCQADGLARSYPRSFSLPLSLSLSFSPRAEYAFRLAVSRLSWVTSPERGRPARVAACWKFDMPFRHNVTIPLGHAQLPKSDIGLDG